MLEKLGRGELSIISSDAIRLDPLRTAVSHSPMSAAVRSFSPPVAPHIHIHTGSSDEALTDEALTDVGEPRQSLPKFIVTAVCTTIMIGSLLYIADRLITTNLLVGGVMGGAMGRENIEDIVTPVTGDVVAGYEVSDEYGIRPFHPVTGEPNVPHNGVDLAMEIGTPIYAVGSAGDQVTVECWWDVDGGGWVVDQTAESYPGYVFQSLHMSEKGCKEGKAKAGDTIAYSGNSGLGTGAHYDFRVKIDGKYVPPATKYLESAVTGEPPKEGS